MKWIKVKDRLPENKVDGGTTHINHVLIFRADKGLSNGYYDDSEWKYSRTPKFGNPLLDSSEVTHWQPFPQPPKD